MCGEFGAQKNVWSGDEGKCEQRCYETSQCRSWTFAPDKNCTLYAEYIPVRDSGYYFSFHSEKKQRGHQDVKQNNTKPKPNRGISFSLWQQTTVFFRNQQPRCFSQIVYSNRAESSLCVKDSKRKRTKEPI